MLQEPVSFHKDVSPLSSLVWLAAACLACHIVCLAPAAVAVCIDFLCSVPLITAGAPTQVPETQQEVDLLLDSNYAIISQLVRLRYSREAGKPLCVENKLMAMLEKNLAKLVACQPPSALISSRTAQATRSMLGSTKETEPGHAPAATQQPLLQGGVMQQSAMQMMPNQTGIGDVTIQQGAIGPGMMQGQPQQHQLHQQQQQQALAQQQQQQVCNYIFDDNMYEIYSSRNRQMHTQIMNITDT